MMSQTDKAVWASGDAYEPYVGRWSRLVAEAFLAWLAVPRDKAWLDVGCGTGAVSSTILRLCAPGRLVGIDPSAAFIAYARRAVADRRAEFQAGDAQSLPLPDETFDAAVSGLVLNFVSEPSRAAAEMARATRRGGTVAAYVWDYAGEMQLMRRFWDAAAALDPRARELDEGRRFPLCRPEALQTLFRDAGLIDVEVRPIDVPTVFRDFDDYWRPFLGGQGPAPGYCVSLGEREREKLRERLRTTLPAEADGTIRLIARTWAVRGTKN